MSDAIDAVFIGGPAHGERRVIEGDTRTYHMLEWPETMPTGFELPTFREHTYYRYSFTKEPFVMLHESLKLGPSSLHPTDQETAAPTPAK